MVSVDQQIEWKKLPSGLKSFEEFHDWVANQSQDWHLVQTLHYNQERLEGVPSGDTEKEIQMHEVQWDTLSCAEYTNHSTL